MTPKQRYTFFIDDAQRAELTAIKTRDGIPESEQIRRAIQDWIEKKGVGKKADRGRSGKRARS